MKKLVALVFLAVLTLSLIPSALAETSVETGSADQTLSAAESAADALSRVLAVMEDSSYGVMNGTISIDDPENIIHRNDRLISGYLILRESPVTLMAGNGYMIRAFLYDAGLGYVNNSGDYGTSVVLTYADGQYARVMVKRSDDMNLSVSEFAGAFSAGLDKLECVLPSAYLAENIEANVADDFAYGTGLQRLDWIMGHYVVTNGDIVDISNPIPYYYNEFINWRCSICACAGGD